MRAPDIEGLAIRSGPESCVGVREGVGEALAGVRAGWAIEPRNQRFVGADVVVVGGRQHRWPRYREWPADPARSKNLCMYGSLHAREPGGPMIARQWCLPAAGRKGKAKAASPR